MTYKKFMEQVKEQILGYLPEEFANADVTIQEINKINDQKYYAVCIKRPKDRMAPNIYLEGYYQSMTDGRSMESILIAIAQTHQECVEKSESFLPFNIEDYQSVKSRLYIMILNKNSNQDYLKDIVCRDIDETDITSVVRVLCTDTLDEKMASFSVKTNMLEMWGISADEVYEQALKNTERNFKPDMRNMKEIFSSEYMENLSEEDENGFGESFYEDALNYKKEEKGKELLPHEMYVLTNTAKIDGATVILYSNLLQEIGEATQSRFFILPSSIHEVILIKDSGEMNAEELRRVVMEINRTQVAPEDVLSDEVYSYDYTKQKLAMATDSGQHEKVSE